MAVDKEDPRLKILEDTMYSIEKNYGKGAIMKLGDGVDNSVKLIMWTCHLNIHHGNQTQIHNFFRQSFWYT